MRKATTSALMLSLALIVSLPVSQPVVARDTERPAQPAPAAPLDTPDVLVANEVSDFTIASPKLYWHRIPDVCPPATAAAEQPNAPASPDLAYTESISRVSVYGSEKRSLWFFTTNNCNIARTIKSNVVADDNYLYWATNTALVRLSTSANVGDAPEAVTGIISGSVELAIDGAYVYALYSTNTSVTIWTVNKSSKALVPIVSRNGISGPANSLAVSSGVRILNADDYVYWLESGRLQRYSMTNGGAPITIDTGVTTFFPEGGHTSCLGLTCFTSDYVFYSTGTNVLRYNNSNNTGSSIYTAPANHTVRKIVSDRANLFLALSEQLVCSPFCSYGDRIYRRSRSSGGTSDLIYTSPVISFFSSIGKLGLAADYLYWNENGAVNRLPKNAAVLPQTNMRITGFSITQGIQKADNSVLLIKDRRTFVRLFVKSDGPGNVSGVTARLTRLSGSMVIDSVLPVNQSGTNLTVRTSPSRSLLDDSFLFELPWSWVSGGTVRLGAVLNPYHAPVESSYADNDLTLGTFTLNNSPVLKVNFVAWGYETGGKIYYPRYIKDIIQTYSWIARGYPLASKITFDGGTGNTPGFHPNLWFEYDDDLGARVMRTHADCQKKPFYYKDTDGTQIDDRSLCASAYTNVEMDKMRSDNGLPKSRFFYGLISDVPKFPRGQACCAENVSSGPAGDGLAAWDTDGAYTDWYAAHEIGHTLGRPHPNSGSDDPATKSTIENCGHSRSDPGFPYGNTSSSRAPIGVGDTEGFDAGDPSLGIPRALLPSAQWNDVMSYCVNQWLSDYTYTAMYNYATSNPSALAASSASDTAAASTTEQTFVNGDFLLVHGSILSGTTDATFSSVQRSSSVAVAPVTDSGAYSIRLFNAGGTQLADNPFEPEPNDDAGPNVLGFAKTVNFAAGTRSVRLIRISDGATLATAAVSANAPVVSNVTLVGASNPATGTIALSWSASDADNDALTFDIFYSSDGGGTFRRVRNNVAASPTTIDSSTLGGSNTAVFRVVASDGANTGGANSASFTLASKPPQPLILTPGNGVTVQYGQLVNFSGAALDWQDGGVTGANLQWRTQAGVVGTGELLSLTDLPVGANVVTLTATNSKGQSASTSVTVNVVDDLSLLGPTLIAGPAQVNWQFGAGATTSASEIIEISNAGSGSIAWSASTSAPWLSISPLTGTVPSSITLTANPSAIADGSVLTGTVILTGQPDSGPTQVLTIPVGLIKDFTLYLYSGIREVYLPLVRR